MNENSTDFEDRETELLKRPCNPLSAKSLRAFAKLVSEHHRHLQSYVRSLCRDEALCNDLVQDTFLAAQQQMERGTYMEKGKCYAWLCAIAKNLLVDHYRHNSRCNTQLFLNHTQICDNLGWASESTGGVSALTMFETPVISAPEKRRKRISNNIGVLMATEFKALSLNEEERKLLCLRYCDEQVFREVSEQTGEPLSTVMSRCYAVMRKVRRQLMSLDAQGLFEKELSLAQMKAYIRKKENGSEAKKRESPREARQRDRMKKMAAYARRNHKCDDMEGVAEEVF